MIKILQLIIPISLFLSSCSMNPSALDIEKWKQEILDTELAFAKLAHEEGIHHAFIAFADDDAVLMRNDELVIGKPAIGQFLKSQTSKGLDWTPDFVDVSASGDLGYTYGHYTFSYTDEEGVVQESTGIFHSVWKRQADGTWKFVWD